MTKKKKINTTDRAKNKRKAMLEAGAYDGRFRPRVVRDKKKYSRKNKRKNSNNE